MPAEDPYDMSVEKPVRGGSYTAARAAVRVCAFAVRLCIVALALLMLFNWAAIIAENANHSSVLTEYTMLALDWFWRIVPWGHITGLDFAIGEHGVFYADVLIPFVIFIVVDGLLDKVYDKLK